MVVNMADLSLRFRAYTDIYGKIRREVERGALIPLVRGVYETDPLTPGEYLAGYIYGPSYLSFEYVLTLYDLIPEGILNTYTSATFRKNKAKRYENRFGTYLYRDIPAAVYAQGVQARQEKGYSYQIAAPEKALCDMLYSLPPLQNLSEIEPLLFDDLRIDESALRALNFSDIWELAPQYRNTNLNFIRNWIKRNGLCSRS